VPCSAAPSFSNAASSCANNHYGDTCQYSCNAGYAILSGVSSLTCNTAGNWPGSINCQCSIPAHTTLSYYSGTSQAPVSGQSATSGFRFTNGNDPTSTLFSVPTASNPNLTSFRCNCIATCLQTNGCVAVYIYLGHNGFCHGLNRVTGMTGFSAQSESWHVAL